MDDRTSFAEEEEEEDSDEENSSPLKLRYMLSVE